MMCAAILGHKENPKVQKPKYENRGINTNMFSTVHVIMLLLAESEILSHNLGERHYVTTRPQHSHLVVSS